MRVMEMRRWAAIALAGLALACGGGDGGDGGDGGNGPGGDPATMERAPGTNDQSARVGTAVATRPAVIVKDEDGAPVGGVTVTFEVTAGGGSVTGATATTNSSGVATVGSWTLGTTAGTNNNKLRASADGLTAVEFTASATDAQASTAKWTVMVFMAADNNLAIAGILDIDEMEAAGVDPNVNVVVQAEFNKTAVAQAGCTNPACFNRPNWNTFRYAITGGGTDINGPNGTAEDIGDRDMTDPAEIKEFILWAKEHYPAERYALVLWNHGGGYVGLLQDETTSGADLMSIGELPAALDGVGKIDLIDFDMCLMAGYETLAMLQGKADVAVFSEEVMPGEGNPYKEIIDALQANPNADARAAGQLIVDQVHGAYSGHRASTTISAYDISQFASFESALNALAGTLQANVDALRPTLQAAAQGSQKYAYPELTDIVSFLDELDAAAGDATLSTQIAAVKTQATGTFRIASRARNGSAQGESDVSRSTGLNIVMPSGVGDDVMGDAGPRSFTAYQTLYPAKAWTAFLADWLEGGTTSTMFDQGDGTRFETYLVWPEAATAAGADVDFWVLEPNGNLYVPFMGSVTPNGTLTNDSYADQTSFEGYLTNRYVEAGVYKIYANLYSAPTATYAVPVELAYRFDQSKAFSELFGTQEPQLTLQTSWLDDDTPTFEEIEAGAYSDLIYAARATIGVPATSADARMMAVRPGDPRATMNAAMATLPGAGTRLTAAQLETARRLSAQRGTQRRPSASASLRPSRLTSRLLRQLAPIGGGR